MSFFIFITILVGRWQGISSLVGMVFSFLIIFKVVLPRVSTDFDPVGSAILGSLIIIPVTFFLSHGWNRKTMVSIFGTLISLVITGFLANIFVNLSKLTGFSSEEANFLQAYKTGAVNVKGMLLVGIIISLLGILYDITVSQSAIVEQLVIANLSFYQLSFT